MKQNHFLAAAFLSFAVLYAFPSVAQTGNYNLYEKPALKHIMKTLVRYGAVDINDDDVIDMYARTNECEIYKDHYKDVFKWEQIRRKLRENIKETAATFPTGFRYDTMMRLDRYDFKKKVYPFANISRHQNVNTFTMQTNPGDYCTEMDMKGFPTSFKLVLDKPVVIEGLPLDQKQGEDLFYRMNMSDNTAHIVYARFNIRVMYIASLATSSEVEARNSDDYAKVAKVRQAVQFDTVVLDSRLDSIEYFEDEEKTKLIYVYRPVGTGL